MLDEVDDVDWPGGGCSCSREVGHGTAAGTGALAWTLGIVGRVVSRYRSSVSDERTACERRRYRKAGVTFDELVMFVTMERPKEKEEVQNSNCIVLGLLVRSKSSLERLKELSKVVPLVACWKGSEVMPVTRRVSEAYCGNRTQPKTAGWERKAIPPKGKEKKATSPQ